MPVNPDADAGALNGHTQPEIRMQRPLVTAIVSTLAAACAHAADAPDYSLTVYSAAQPGQISTSTLANYGENLPGYALVRDSRSMTLEKGVGDLRFTDVAKRIDPTTVAFESLSDPSGTRVMEQNYQYDLVDNAKLLDRYIGQTITVEQVRGDKTDTLSGKLLSANGGLILQRDSGEVLTLNSYSNIRFPALPGGLISRPTLVWKVNSQTGGQQNTRVSYQTQGITWWSDYNITMREKNGACDMDLAAWVTLVNQSGGSFANAQLKLVAGEVNRAPAAPPPAPTMRKMAMLESAPALANGFVESSLSEYHLYTLGRRTDLAGQFDQAARTVSRRARLSRAANSSCSPPRRRSAAGTVRSPIRDMRPHPAERSVRISTSTTRKRKNSACRCRPDASA